MSELGISKRTLICDLCLLILACGDPATEVNDDGGALSSSSGAGDISNQSVSTAEGGLDTRFDDDASSGADTDTAGDLASADGGELDDGGIKFDIGNFEGEASGDGDGDAIDFSYIWIANSAEGTVSKIDTRTKVELGRYYTGPAGERDPSRTSVNLNGNAVVVNREGGITKITAWSDACPDRNGDGLVRTSTGPGDVLDWGQDDCVEWHALLPSGSRPAAWTSGDRTVDPITGQVIYRDAHVWTSGPEGAMAVVFLLDGETGEVRERIEVEGVCSGAPCIYGGAVDSENNFWGVTHTTTHSSGAQLVRVDHDDMSVTLTKVPDGESYGITVDENDRVWVGTDRYNDTGQLKRYDPETDEWLILPFPEFGASQLMLRGMTPDGKGSLWVALAMTQGDNGLLGIDIETGAVRAHLGPDILPGVSTPAGASVDVDGIIWLVDESANGAFAVEPQMNGSYAVEFVGGLNLPYTYSDMTGFALRNVSDDPPE